MERLASIKLVVVGDRLRLHVFLACDEILELAALRLGRRVAEEFLSRQVPGGDVPVEVERHDGSWTDLEQCFEIARLPPSQLVAFEFEAAGRRRIPARSIEAEANPATTRAFATSHGTLLRLELAPNVSRSEAKGEHRGNACPPNEARIHESNGRYLSIRKTSPAMGLCWP
jgi:hypothetical protein